MKTRNTATITITFTDEEDIVKCRKAHGVGYLTYKDIYMRGVEIILKENILNNS